MIVGACFDGDTDRHAMDMQDHAYHEALWAIVTACQNLAHASRIILGGDPAEAPPLIRSFDHRTLQGAHDLLAAAWRCRHRPAQGALPLSGAPPWPEPDKAAWLSWVSEEACSWVQQPELVYQV